MYIITFPVEFNSITINVATITRLTVTWTNVILKMFNPLH